MIKVDLITGFLGAGKTTFIKRYADYLQTKGQKVHIIENEFGGISIDANTLRGEDCDVSQITGGCMCCSGRISFQNLLLNAAKGGFDRILVEPSGIYDVGQFFSILNTPPVNSECEIGNIITIADSRPDALLSSEARYLMYSQLIFTGKVVLSKTQLNTESDIDAAVEDLNGMLREFGSARDVREEDVLIRKPWDALTDEDYESILSCGYRMSEQAEDIIDHMSVFRTEMMTGKFDTEENLRAILRKLLNTDEYGRIYRIKGYISNLEGKWFDLNASPDGITVKPVDIKRGLFLLIGQDFDVKAIQGLFYDYRYSANKGR